VRRAELLRTISRRKPWLLICTEVEHAIGPGVEAGGFRAREGFAGCARRSTLLRKSQQCRKTNPICDEQVEGAQQIRATMIRWRFSRIEG